MNNNSMKYLTDEQLKANLSLGKSVEQWLTPNKYDNYIALRWLRIDKEINSTYTTRYIECFDDGDEQFTDIYEFSPIHPDDPELLNTFTSVDEVLHFATVTYSALLDKFVTAGMIQEEYKNYLINKR